DILGMVPRLSRSVTSEMLKAEFGSSIVPVGPRNTTPAQPLATLSLLPRLSVMLSPWPETVTSVMAAKTITSGIAQGGGLLPSAQTHCVPPGAIGGQGGGGGGRGGRGVARRAPPPATGAAVGAPRGGRGGAARGVPRARPRAAAPRRP